jgi:hypothetical protein
MTIVPKGTVITPSCYQKICRPEHFMMKFQGVGISENILLQLKQEGVTLIRIIYQGKTGIVIYITTVRTFLESTYTHTHDTNDIQKFVSTKDMVVS